MHMFKRVAQTASAFVALLLATSGAFAQSIVVTEPDPIVISPADVGQTVAEASEAVAFAEKGVAPPLTKVWHFQVESAQGGTESIAVNQTTTKKNHGGKYLYVYTFELGYGRFVSATMAGRTLSRNVVSAVIRMCFDGTKYTSKCRAGQKIVGFVDIFDLSGYSSGSFYYKATSEVYPYKAFSDTLKIN